MQITLEHIQKKYNRHSIFQEVNYLFSSAHNYVILGQNGSGKSTLLKLIAGSIIPSKGHIHYQHENSEIKDFDLIRHVSIAAPYLDLVEEMTLNELLEFYQRFKPFQEELDLQKIIDVLNLGKTTQAIAYFSSGMKQRVKLALAILSDTNLLLLDEPTSNLDPKGVEWYQDLMRQYNKDRITIVASNYRDYEYFFCDKELHMKDFK